jgi:anthranilate phosphoribosyltransferase
MIKDSIAKLLHRRNLTADEAEATMQQIMDGAATPAQIGAYLIGLCIKGETESEISGSARAMRDRAVRVHHKVPRVVDIVGTGGDKAGTFNISTTAAFVVAGAGVPVAKHGSRASSSQTGASDVLTALGVNVIATPEQVAECIETIGIGFMFAPTHHPAMKNVAAPRRELGIHTIFNILGPLTNPAWVKHQLVGTFSEDLTELMAKVLRDLGSVHSLVVNTQGTDELLAIGEATVSELRNGEVHTYKLDPADLGFKRVALSELGGGSADFNASITRVILAGKDVQARTEAVLLNAAAALYAADAADSIAEGVELARESIGSGAALAKLDALAEKTQSFAPPAA